MHNCKAYIAKLQSLTTYSYPGMLALSSRIVTIVSFCELAIVK